MQRRTLSGLGAVMLPPPRWPPQLRAAAEQLGVDAGAARAARTRGSRACSTPAPAPGTKPPALALIGRDAFSGSSLKPRAQHAHGVEAGPDVVAGALGAAAQHALGQAAADARRAHRDRLGAGAARARVGRDLVAEREQARDARRDAARHHLLDGGAAEPAHLACVRQRHDARADRVHAADPGADHGARCPSRRGRRRAPGRARPASLPGVDRGDRARSGGSSSSRAAASSSKYGVGDRVDALRHARHLAAEAELRDLRRARGCPERPLRSASSKSREAVAVRRDHAEAGDDDALAHCASPPCPESVARADERTVFEAHLDVGAQLAPAEEDLARA